MSEVNDAIALWDKLEAGFLYQQETLEEILESEAWKPIGYASMFEAWEEKGSRITLAKELALRLAAHFLGEGVDSDRIALSLNGIAPETVKNVERELANNTPPINVRGRRERPGGTGFNKPIYVPAHGREKASPTSFIRFEVGPSMRAEYDRIAVALGRPTADIAKEGAERHFAELAKSLAGRKKRAS